MTQGSGGAGISTPSIRELPTTYASSPLVSGPQVQIFPMAPEFMPGLYRSLMQHPVYQLWRTRGQYLAPSQFEEFLGSSRIAAPLVRRSDNQVVGLAELLDYSPTDHHGQLSIGVAEDCWDTGLGIEAAFLFLSYVFDEVALRKVSVLVDSTNPRLGRGLARLFEHEGRLRDHLYISGEWHDVDLYAIWKHEFRKIADRVAPRLMAAET